MQQLPLDAVPLIDTNRRAARRSALEDAKARADDAITRVADKAERERPGWCEDATQALRTFAKRQGGVFTIEHARLAILAAKLIDKPHDGRAWGKATRMAVTAGYIERVKGQSFPAASSNGSPKPVYRKGAKA